MKNKNYLISLFAIVGIFSATSVFAHDEITYYTQINVQDSSDVTYEVCASDSAGAFMKGCSDPHNNSAVINVSYDVSTGDNYLEPGLDDIVYLDQVQSDSSCTAYDITREGYYGVNHIEAHITMNPDYNNYTFYASANIVPSKIIGGYMSSNVYFYDCMWVPPSK